MPPNSLPYGMVIVSLFKLNHNELSGIFTITAEEIICCPLCSGELLYRDSRLRMLKDFLGELSYFYVRRLRCQTCKKIHTELPSIIQPYRHYSSAAIQSVLDGNEPGCAADNSTIHRWKTEFAAAEPDIGQRLASVYAQITGETVPMRSAYKILGTLKTKCEHWLIFVMALLINSGHKLCTRFAYCPLSSTDTVKSTNFKETERSKEDDKAIENSS